MGNCEFCVFAKPVPGSLYNDYYICKRYPLQFIENYAPQPIVGKEDECGEFKPITKD